MNYLINTIKSTVDGITKELLKLEGQKVRLVFMQGAMIKESMEFDNGKNIESHKKTIKIDNTLTKWIKEMIGRSCEQSDIVEIGIVE